MSARRLFRGPGGRTWTAQLLDFPATGTGLAGHLPADRTGLVLRFSAGDAVLDLAEWPDDWMQWPDEKLVLLVQRGTAPARIRAARMDFPRPLGVARDDPMPTPPAA